MKWFGSFLVVVAMCACGAGPDTGELDQQQVADYKSRTDALSLASKSDPSEEMSPAAAQRFADKIVAEKEMSLAATQRFADKVVAEEDEGYSALHWGCNENHSCVANCQWCGLPWGGTVTCTCRLKGVD